MKKTIIITALLLSGCGSNSFITEKGVRLAYDECAKHDGLMAVQPHSVFFAGDYYDGYPIAICEDLLVLDLGEMKEKRDFREKYGNKPKGIVNE